MRVFLCVALLCAVGCSSVATEQTQGEQRRGIQYWIPETIDDICDVMDANIGLDYGFGAHIKFTDLARIGIFDYADFALIGFDSQIFDGVYAGVNMAAWSPAGLNSWQLQGKIGAGLGAMLMLDPWEFVDLISTFVTLNYFSFDDD